MLLSPYSSPSLLKVNYIQFFFSLPAILELKRNMSIEKQHNSSSTYMGQNAHTKMRFVLFLGCLLLLCNNPVPASTASEPSITESDAGNNIESLCTYSGYLCSYYGRLLKEREVFPTARPLTEEEFTAVYMSIEFIIKVPDESGKDAESTVLSERHNELKSLLLQGRIKGDDDPEEMQNATKMTTHIPSDPQDPFQGDIYVHDRSLLQNVCMPLMAIEKLDGSDMPAPGREGKIEICRKSLFEGIVLLSSYLIHECRHRKQHLPSENEKNATVSDYKRVLTEMEDPAYTDQCRFLLYVYRNTQNPQLKARIRSVADTIFHEIIVQFPEMRLLREVQNEFEKSR